MFIAHLYDETTNTLERKIFTISFCPMAARLICSISEIYIGSLSSLVFWFRSTPEGMNS